MSLNDAIQSYIEENPEITKSDFLKMVGELFANAKKGKMPSKKGAKNEVVEAKKGGKKKSDKVDDEEKPEKKLNPYQAFMKEQMPILQKRESEKEDGEPKKKPRELMTEISEMWKAKKEAAV